MDVYASKGLPVLVAKHQYSVCYFYSLTQTDCFVRLVNHPCVTNPNAVCLNGGTCTINGAGYVCKCPTGWSGENCRTQDGSQKVFIVEDTGRMIALILVSCPVGYCLNNSTCRLNGYTIYCDCPQLYTGQRCETSILTVTSTTTTTVAPGKYALLLFTHSNSRSYYFSSSTRNLYSNYLQ
jgi:hypothetical protein